jgi:hypothetical protein
LALYDLVFKDDTGAQIQFTKPKSELKTDEEKGLAVRKVHEFVQVEERLRGIAEHPAILAMVDGATPHYEIRDWQLCDAHVQVEKDVAVPLLPGGLLLFHGLLKHGTPHNLSSKKHRALQFHYAGESAAKLTPKEYKRFFTNEMSGAEC